MYLFGALPDIGGLLEATVPDVQQVHRLAAEKGKGDGGGDREGGEKEGEEEEEEEEEAHRRKRKRKPNQPSSPAGRFISGGAPAADPASVVNRSQYNSKKKIFIYLEKEYITYPFKFSLIQVHSQYK